MPIECKDIQSYLWCGEKGLAAVVDVYMLFPKSVILYHLSKIHSNGK